MIVVDICRKCSNSRPIVNKKYYLCEECNYKRLHGDKPRKKHPLRSQSKKHLFTRAQEERCYEEVFNSKSHRCEECGVELSSVFRDEDGRVVDRYQYSHILSKGAWPELRFHPKNFNRLCMSCHTRWESGDRKSMSIFERNKVVIEGLLRERRV